MHVVETTMTQFGTGADYDDIGRLYSRHRRPDPRIAAQIWAALGDARTVLDVGAGTGSYEPPDRHVVAVEPSATMIAQRAPTAAPVVQAVAEHLPFAAGSFDAAMAVLTQHHWPDRIAGLREVRRVTPGPIVVLTFDPAFHNEFWLVSEYLPEGARLGFLDPFVQEIADTLGNIEVQTVPVPHDCIDGFFWAYWRRPQMYLDAGVRACISGLATLDERDLEPGLRRLAGDLRTGAWHARHRDLLALDAIDGGYRLVISRS